MNDIQDVSNRFTSLDEEENEEPTIWMTQPQKNLVNVVIGTDPTDPIKNVKMSPGEIERLFNETEFYDF
jgi:hypothetical protein